MDLWMNHATPTAWKRTDVLVCWACVEPPRWFQSARDVRRKRSTTMFAFLHLLFVDNGR